jgi:hypothetical protein
MTDTTPAPATASPTPTATPRHPSRGRRALALVTLVLACLVIVAATMGVWARQTLLNTDRFTALAGEVIDEPVIIAPISERVSTQVVESLDIEARVAEALPGPSTVLAPAIANAVREAIDSRLQQALANPQFQQALSTTVSTTHSRIVALLRDESTNLTVIDGYVYLNVFPIVGTALTELQQMGLIPASVVLPDLSSPEAPEALAQRLESALGITLPATFGSIKLMPADKLLQAQSIVRVFDIVVIGLVILAVILVALAIWLSTDRRGMVIALAIGTFIAFILTRLALGAVREALIAGVEEEDMAAALRAILQVTFADLRTLSLFALIATAIVAIAAFFIGRTESMEASLNDVTAAENRSRLMGIGLAIIGVVVLWIAIGPEVAFLALALLLGWWFVVGRLANDPA